MIRLLTIIGTRPQIIKSAALTRAIRRWNETHKEENRIEEVLLHTGQHYDTCMSEVFFRELEIPTPTINLGVRSVSHGDQTARMITGIEQVLLTEPFDGVVIYGDTNSTLAGAIAVSKLSVPLFHIEAGLRSKDLHMPEEINRKVADQLSSILFAPTHNAIKNLKREGFSTFPVTVSAWQNQYAVLSGDVMYDNALFFGTKADATSTILDSLSLTGGQYILVTIHRAGNVDNKQVLTRIFTALSHIANSDIGSNGRIVVPLHPRTRAKIKEFFSTQTINKYKENKRFCFISPVSYFDMIVLEKNAMAILTDSGGVQKEAYFYQVPCVVLRKETEWSEIIKVGAGSLISDSPESILRAFKKITSQKISFAPLFGRGHAAEKILKHVVQFLKGKSQ